MFASLRSAATASVLLSLCSGAFGRSIPGAVGFTPAFDLSERTLGLRGYTSSCGTTGQTSCHNTTAQSDLCCFEAPGGLLTHVQFWDTDPVTGPDDSWTIHGLWPDHCDQTYDSNCDSSRAYTDITSILQNAGRQDLVDYMTTYMQSNSESPESFWEHEWGKHGTCMSTLKPACIPSGSQTGEDAVYFFDRLVNLHKNQTTYDWLSQAGILPDSSKTWTLSQLTSAIKSATGFIPAFDCSSGEVYQMYYYYNLKGSIIDGKLIPIDAPKGGTCPSSGIKYLPKNGGSSSPPSSTTSSGGSMPTGTPSKGYLRAVLSDSGSSKGCLLTAGTWSVQTCATYTVTTSGSGVTLSTSKGKCAVSGGAITCGSSVSSATVFGTTTSGSSTLLTYSGSTAFTADSTPSGTSQVTVYTGSSHSTDFTLQISSS